MKTLSDEQMAAIEWTAESKGLSNDEVVASWLLTPYEKMRLDYLQSLWLSEDGVNTDPLSAS